MFLIGKKHSKKDSRMGALKPKKVDRVTMSVVIKRKYRDWIDKVTKKQKVSKSSFVESIFEVVENVPPDFMVELMNVADNLKLPLSVVVGNTILWRLVYLTTYRKVHGKNAPDAMHEFYVRNYAITDDKGNREEVQGIPTGEIAGQIVEMVLTEALEKYKEVRDKLHATAEAARKKNIKIEGVPVAEVIDNFLEHAI